MQSLICISSHVVYSLLYFLSTLSIANLAIAAGAANPVGVFVGIIGGVIAYNQATKQYELQKLNAGKVKVITFIDHPVNPEKAYACE